MSKKTNRTKNIKVRTTEAEYQAIKKTADARGTSVSELLRSLCTSDGAESNSLLSSATIGIIRNHTLCQISNHVQFWDIPDDIKTKILEEIKCYV